MMKKLLNIIVSLTSRGIFMEDLFNKNPALLKGLYRCAFFTALRANRIAKKRKSKEYFVDPDIYLETVEEITDLNLAEITATEFTKEPREKSAHYIKNWWYWLGMYTLALFELSRSTKIIYDKVDLLRERGISVSESEIDVSRKSKSDLGDSLLLAILSLL